MKREHWHYIKGYGQRYKISDRGHVLSFNYGRETILKTPLNFRGKPCVCLSRNGWTQTYTIASLIESVFGKCTQNNKRTTAEYNKQYRQQLRFEVLNHYSSLRGVKNPDGSDIVTPCCGTCQENDLSKLTIDHIAGGGNAHRKSLKRQSRGFYLWLKQQGYPEGYQTLCRIHNRKKRDWDSEY